jgi:hypothetical protein
VKQQPGSRTRPARPAGPTRNTSPLSCPAKSPPAKLPAPRCGPGRPDFLPANHWRTSASTTSRALNATPSRTWPPARSSPKPPTSSCSDRPAPAKPILRPGWACAPPSWATGCCSRLLSTGSPGSRLRIRAGGCRRSWSGCAATGLIIVDEVGYIPFEQDAANLFFQLVSSRYEHAPLILTSNLPFARWGDVLGDQIVASAMIDRIVHHAEVITLKGSSYRLKRAQTDSLPSTRPENAAE